MNNPNYLLKLCDEILNDDFNVQDHLGADRYGHFFCTANTVVNFGVGGSAFREWVAGLFRDGIYVYVRNHRLAVQVTTDPNARLCLGCQDSCAHGDPFPKTLTGQWINPHNFPSELAQKIYNKATKLMQEAATAVKKKCSIDIDNKEQKKKQHQEKQQQVVDMWEQTLSNT